MEEQLNPQVDIEHEALDVAGAETPQQPTPPVQVQPGAEVTPPRPERTYSQEEWSKRESAKDREVAQLRQQMVDRDIQHQLAFAEAQDGRAVNDGELTTEQAAQRKQDRLQTLAQQQALAQQWEAVQGVMRDAEGFGRILAARDFGKQYGVDMDELLKDTSIISPLQMKARAAELALEKTKAAQKAPETYDSGLMGTTSASLDKMSPEEKVLYALNHPQRKNK